MKTAVALWSSKWFALGMVVAIGAWLLHVAALAMAPMSVVQAVLAGGVVLLAVMAERLFGLSVGPRQWAGVGCTAAGLILLGVTLPHSGSAHSTFSSAGMIAFEGGLIGLGARVVERLFLHLALGDVAHHRNHLGLAGRAARGQPLLGRARELPLLGVRAPLARGGGPDRSRATCP